MRLRDLFVFNTFGVNTFLRAHPYDVKEDSGGDILLVEKSEEIWKRGCRTSVSVKTYGQDDIGLGDSGRYELSRDIITDVEEQVQKVVNDACGWGLSEDGKRVSLSRDVKTRLPGGDERCYLAYHHPGYRKFLWTSGG